MAQRGLHLDADYIADQRDYASLNIPDELIAQFREIEVHKMPVDGVEIRESKRHGLGVFATESIGSGAIIAPAMLDGRLMEYSRYCNHSKRPNAAFDQKNREKCDLVATSDIGSCEEVTVDYREGLKELTWA